MPELELRRSPDDRRLYELEGVGTLRLEGLASRRATAEAAGRSWQLARRGVWRRGILATDGAGGEAGEFTPRALRRGGTLVWLGRELALRPASRWRERYALVDGETELAVFDARSWGKRPVKVTLHGEAGAQDPGLLLFAAFIARDLAADADAVAAGATAATG
jgi:hypothetical protein